MARKMTEWPSKRGPITKIMPSDGCIGDTVPLAVGKWSDFHEFGWYMGNVGWVNFRRNSTYDTVFPGMDGAVRPPAGALVPGGLEAGLQIRHGADRCC